MRLVAVPVYLITLDLGDLLLDLLVVSSSSWLFDCLSTFGMTDSK